MYNFTHHGEAHIDRPVSRVCSCSCRYHWHNVLVSSSLKKSLCLYRVFSISTPVPSALALSVACLALGRNPQDTASSLHPSCYTDASLLCCSHIIGSLIGVCSDVVLSVADEMLPQMSHMTWCGVINSPSCAKSTWYFSYGLYSHC